MIQWRLRSTFPAARGWTPTLEVTTSKPTNHRQIGADAVRAFLASIGTCAGIYVLGFCQQRKIPTDGIRIVQRMENDPATGLVGKSISTFNCRPDFPEKYKQAVIRSAEQCK